MKLKIKFERSMGLCFAGTHLENGDPVQAAGQSWEDAEKNLIEKVRIETGFIDMVPPDKEIEIEGKPVEETGSLFSAEADKQFEHPPVNTPQDYHIQIPIPNQTQTPTQTKIETEIQNEPDTVKTN